MSISYLFGEKFAMTLFSWIDAWRWAKHVVYFEEVHARDVVHFEEVHPRDVFHFFEEGYARDVHIRDVVVPIPWDR